MQGKATTTIIFVLLSVSGIMAQSTVQSRITQPVDEQKQVRLAGNTHPLAQSQFDRGAAPDDLPMERVLLLLQRGADQEAELQKLLEDQQSKSSPQYHKWLTPEQFGQRFGPADADIAAVTNWLGSQGFRVSRVAAGRTVIEFSGTAAQLRQAFRTEIHKFVVNGEEHWANASDPQIPAALAPVVRGFMSLHNFRKKPHVKILQQKIPAKLVPGERPQATFGSSHALAPGDFAVIYNTNPILHPPVGSGPPAGAGTTIAVVGRSNIDVSDVNQFRSIFGLPSTIVQVILDGPDPGDLGGGEEVEAVLDATWSGAVAPGAIVYLVVSASTEATDGIDLSELFIIDNNSGAIMTESFGTCEANVTSTQAAGISQLAEQAAAQGITYIVSTGDSGSAGCDDPTETQAAGPVSVNVLASTPFNVAVGGTEFNEHGNDSLYWNPADSSPGSFTSALSYIPENVWNESCTVAQCGQENANIAAGGGGASQFFSKPAWQSGVTGIPSDGKRDVPDVALTSALFNDPYLLCVAHSCDPDQLGNFFFVGVGGTSVAAQAFGGIMAMVNVNVPGPPSVPRLGQINRVLYGLAAKENLSNCNGSSITGLPATNCIFNDVTSGNNAVPGEPNFDTPAKQYQSGLGYDLASGLGSVNVANLINNWNTSFSPTTTTLSLNPTTLTHGTPVQVNIHVTSPDGTPTGDVALRTNDVVPAVPGVPGLFTLNGSGSASATIKSIPAGTYGIDAHYAGDGTFDASDSSPVSVIVTAEASDTFLHLATPSTGGTQYNTTTVTYGSPYVLRADVTNVADSFHATPLCSTGCPAGSVTITANGALLDAGIFFLNSLGYTEDLPIQLAAGATPYALHAAYQGDLSFNPSSADLSVTVTQAQSTTSLTANPSSGVTTATPVLLTATVSTQSNSAVGPSGTVTFSGNGLPGFNVPVTSIPASAAGFAAASAWAEALYTAGNWSITAKYNGDTNYASSPTTAPILFTVTQASPAPVATASSLTVTAGGSANTTVTITPTGGFTGQVTVSCLAAALPPGVTCGTFTVTLGSTAVQQSMAVSVAAPSAPGTIASISPGTIEYAKKRGGPSKSGWWMLSASAGLAGMFLLVVPGRSRHRGTLFLWLVCFLSFTIGCGGGGGSNSVVTPTPAQAASTTRVGVSQTKVPSNTTLTFAAAVTSPISNPTGTVQFFDGTAPLGAAAALANGEVEISSSSLSVGTHAISAHYSGDTRTVASQSGTVNVTVTGTTTVGIATSPASNGNATFNLTIN